MVEETLMKKLGKNDAWKGGGPNDKEYVDNESERRRNLTDVARLRRQISQEILDVNNGLERTTHGKELLKAGNNPIKKKKVVNFFRKLDGTSNEMKEPTAVGGILTTLWIMLFLYCVYRVMISHLYGTSVSTTSQEWTTRHGDWVVNGVGIFNVTTRCTNENGCLLRRHYGGGSFVSQRCVNALRDYPFKPESAFYNGNETTLFLGGEAFTREDTTSSICHRAANGESVSVMLCFSDSPGDGLRAQCTGGASCVDSMSVVKDDGDVTIYWAPVTLPGTTLFHQVETTDYLEPEESIGRVRSEFFPQYLSSEAFAGYGTDPCATYRNQYNESALEFYESEMLVTLSSSRTVRKISRPRSLMDLLGEIGGIWSLLGNGLLFSVALALTIEQGYNIWRDRTKHRAKHNAPIRNLE